MTIHFVVVFVMNHFVLVEFSSKLFFHYGPMNSNTTNFAIFPYFNVGVSMRKKDRASFQDGKPGSFFDFFLIFFRDWKCFTPWPDWFKCSSQPVIFIMKFAKSSSVTFAKAILKRAMMWKETRMDLRPKLVKPYFGCIFLPIMCSAKIAGAVRSFAAWKRAEFVCFHMFSLPESS